MCLPPHMAAMLQRLSPEKRKQFDDMMADRKRSRPQQKEALVANSWLRDKMALLCVRKELMEKIDFQIGRMCSLQDVWPPGMWAKAVAYHNGFCKTVLELKQHYRGK
jgi:hypothetical protein